LTELQVQDVLALKSTSESTVELFIFI